MNCRDGPQGVHAQPGQANAGAVTATATALGVQAVSQIVDPYSHSFRTEVLKTVVSATIGSVPGSFVPTGPH